MLALPGEAAGQFHSSTSVSHAGCSSGCSTGAIAFVRSKDTKVMLDWKAYQQQLMARIGKVAASLARI